MRHRHFLKIFDTAHKKCVFRGIQSLAASCLVLTTLCGCSGILSEATSLMRPPYSSGDGSEIQSLLDSELGNVTLKYPKSGSYRSAITLIDLNNDNSDEAVVFYTTDTSSTVSFAVMTKNDGEWELANGEDSGGGSVERVMFGDIDGDGVLEIIIGWTAYSTGSNIISAYSFNGDDISSIDVREYSEETAENVSVPYTDMQIYDFDDDGKDEIIASYINSSDFTASAKLIEFYLISDNHGAMTVTDTAQLDGHVSSYSETKISKLTSDGVYGVVLDGIKDDSTSITEFIYWDKSKGALVTPFYDADEQGVTQTVRSIAVNSTDIDYDGVVEIPTTEYLPGYDETSETPVYLTTWYLFDFDDSGYSLTSRKKTVINISEGYSVAWFSSWEGEVTCRLDEKNRILYFYHYQPEKSAFSDEIFRIKAFSTSEWDELDENSGYVEIQSTVNTVYAASLSSGQEYAALNVIKSAFSFI